MNDRMKYLGFIFALSCLAIPLQVFSQDSNNAVEPAVKGKGSIDLLEGGSLDAWEVPSSHWYIEEGRIIGQTGGEELKIPEWLYTRQQFSDFEFTCELKLTGDNHRNTGIYFRVTPFLYEGYESFEAPSGYEFDAAYHNPSGKNYWGSLGDWYARQSLRIYPDQTIINQVYMPEKWNRITIRARENRLEYWINGIKVLDYLDKDPKASTEGVIGFQIHNGSVMKVEYRNINILPLETVE